VEWLKIKALSSNQDLEKKPQKTKERAQGRLGVGAEGNVSQYPREGGED
jgi:hypothetical protein